MIWFPESFAMKSRSGSDSCVFWDVLQTSVHAELIGPLAFLSLGGCKRLKKQKHFERLSSRWTCFSTHMQPSWRGHLQCGFMIYSCSLLMARLWEFVLTRDIFPCSPLVSNFSALLTLVVVLCRVPGSNMQPPPAAAALLWSLLFSLDLLSAVQPQPNQRDVPNDEPGAQKKQPHIVFILIDDQVCKHASVTHIHARGEPPPAITSRGRCVTSLLIQLVTA